MRIGLGLSLNVEAPRGADVYFHGLVQGLCELPPKHRFVLFSCFYKDFEAKAARLPRPAGVQFELAYKRWPERLVRALEAVGLPVLDRALVRPAGLSLFHALGGEPPKVSVPSVVTVYDLLPEVLHERAAARGERVGPPPRSAGVHAHRADRIVAISGATRDDLVRVYGVDPRKIAVVHLGVDHALFRPVENAEPVRRKYGLPSRYLLFVGPFEYRRNTEAGLAAFAALRRSGLDCGAVLVGKENAYAQTLRALAASLGVEKHVVFTGFVPREELPALYSSALAFVHPEHYDGFSLQLLEAMACGAPAVISDAPALTEIAQGDALVSTTDARTLEKTLARLFQEEGLPQKLSARSLARAAQFSWKKTAEQTVAVYESM